MKKRKINHRELYRHAKALALFCNETDCENCPFAYEVDCGFNAPMLECTLAGPVPCQWNLGRVAEKGMDNSINRKPCRVIESDDAEEVEKLVGHYLDNGYKIESSSCNCKMYKVIMTDAEE